MFERVKMVFLPFRAVVGIGIQKIESLGVKLEEIKIWSLFATVLSCYSSRVKLQFLVSCYSDRQQDLFQNGYNLFQTAILVFRPIKGLLQGF